MLWLLGVEEERVRAMLGDLTVTRARTVGVLGGATIDSHAVVCAGDRGWALVTDDATRYSGSRTDGIEIEPLP